MSIILGFLCILFKFCLVDSVDDLDIPLIPSEEACGENQPMIVKNKFAYLASPRFDPSGRRLVQPNLDCSWLLSAPRDRVIDIKSIFPRKPVGGNCSEDFLKIFDGTVPIGNPLGISCQFRSIYPVISTANSLFIQFKTGPKPIYTGFKLYFEHTKPEVPCYGQEKPCRHRQSCFVPSMQCDGIAHCSDGSDEENCQVDDILPEDCGQPDIPPVLWNDRIVGGRPAIRGSWPWMVSLRIPKNEPKGHECGGTLIAEKWVLTAAHCFRNCRDPDCWVVVVGKHHRMIRDEEEQTRYIDKIIVYPEFKGLEPLRPNLTWLYMKAHDIALVKLNAPVTFNSYVKPACLPDYIGEIEPRTICHVTGWGMTLDTGYDYVLKQAAVPVVQRDVCDNMLKTKTIGETMLCAGYSYGGHDACMGDSGGPLVLRDGSNRWHTVGIVSTGEGCAAHNSPGIYTEVVHYVRWIDHTITGRKENSNTSPSIMD